MKAHIEAITTHLQQQLSAAIRQVFDMAEPPELRLDKPPQPELGDFAVGCFPLARPLRQAPPKIAAALAEALPVTEFIEKVDVAGPYLNITINKAQFFRIYQLKIGSPAKRRAPALISPQRQGFPNIDRPHHLFSRD